MFRNNCVFVAVETVQRSKTLKAWLRTNGLYLAESAIEICPRETGRTVVACTSEFDASSSAGLFEGDGFITAEKQKELLLSGLELGPRVYFMRTGAPPASVKRSDPTACVKPPCHEPCEVALDAINFSQCLPSETVFVVSRAQPQ